MANWVLKAHAVSGNADGLSGPFKAPTGAGTVNATGADIYLVALSYYNQHDANLNAAVIADKAGNTYTYLPHQQAAGDANNSVEWAYVVSPTTSATEQITVTPSGGVPTNTGVCFLAFSGTNTGTPNVRHIESGTTSSTPSAGSIGSSGDLVVTAVADYTATVSSIDSSFAITDQSNYTSGNNIGIAAAWQNAAGGVGGSVNPTWTLSASPTASSVQAVAVAAAGGGASRGLFLNDLMGGMGTGGSFFRNPLTAPFQMRRKDRIFVPARFAV